MSCVLRIGGLNFQVEEYLAATGLEATRVWLVGTPRSYAKSAKEVHEESGCNITVSEADFDQLEQQKTEAVNFLERHLAVLQQLSEFGWSMDDGAVLDFGIYNRMDQCYFQSDYFEPRLLYLLAQLRFTLGLSQYGTASDEEE